MLLSWEKIIVNLNIMATIATLATIACLTVMLKCQLKSNILNKFFNKNCNSQPQTQNHNEMFDSNDKMIAEK